jgi:hypothetical protein
MRLDQLPLSLMHHPVVAMAQKNEIGQITRASSDPVDQVVA